MCLIFILCFGSTNCADCSTHSHRALVKASPFTADVLDLRNGCDPYDISLIGLKVLGEAIFKDTTIGEVKILFDSMRRKTKKEDSS